MPTTIHQLKQSLGKGLSSTIMSNQNVPKPNNYLAFAIFTTVCCCLPTGIYAIIRAMKVNEYYTLEQYDAATQASQDAKKWSLIGLIAGLVVNILVYAFYGSAALSSVL